MTAIFWTMATSYLALGIVSLVTLAALLVGYLPLLKYFPVIGPYVMAARLVLFLQIALLFFLLGTRFADEREALKDLKATVEATTIDLNETVAAEKEADDARTELLAQAATDQKRIADYEADLKKHPIGNCALTDDDLRWLRESPRPHRPLSPAGK